MSVTDAEYAMLSNAIYHDKDFIAPENYGFTYVRGGGDDKTGFYGEVYQRDKDLILVFRGSANALNAKHDLQWGINGTPPPELGSAMEFYNKVVRDYRNTGLSISMTGHSLGGSAVQYVDARLVVDGGRPVPGVTFAPAGVAALFPQIPPNSLAIRNYIRKGDLVPGIMDKQLGYEIVLLPFKNESYEVQYKNGIGEIVATPGEVSPVVQHSSLGYFVDIGNLKTRTSDKWLDLRDSLVKGTQSGSLMANMKSFQEAIVPARNAFTFNSNLLFNQSAMNEFHTPDSHYFQSPEQQSQNMEGIAYLQKEPLNVNNKFDKIALEIGDTLFKTKPYMDYIA